MVDGGRVAVEPAKYGKKMVKGGCWGAHGYMLGCYGF